MPIHVHADMRRLTNSEFHQLAYKVMGVIFQVHNEFSRLIDEANFKTIIRQRALRAGIPCQREVEIEVSHGRFRKSYYLDFLFARSLIVEAKTVEALNEVHHAQTLNYLLLSEMRDGLLVNLRSERVRKRFVSTNLNEEKRREIEFDDSGYQADSSHDGLLSIVKELLDDWGLFLSAELYLEAIVFLNRIGAQVPSRVAVYDDGVHVGWHEGGFISNQTMVSVTALVRGQDEMKQQLRKLVRNTSLESVQWLNLDHHQVTLQTVA
ncbi:MAG: GxxExxY protein [Planctomycetota bacterium]